ncbi:3D domain-containing protein [Bacillus atrophaeus]|uniref:3D domain-containing protein n=1 Tax=Bacillus atrophaeus TaxID=1452 RepID=UPI00227E0B3B|nr:3D domain-containing protein [Bacillus atrophaeus]MCY7947981.1 3D domain-containing protein [Bacillus atrophaeus]MCY8098073.1 3D domain-containing protein [Bacillus atrophaeus]MCY9169997.1 3D domain-containing protein [Bacillus atrophaeus]MEC0740723.1 3D domain-containing protein [Bacillus atrophaeus]MEC0747014.1 3D domain-containing protein [Bacillus atrophaeus]
MKNLLSKESVGKTVLAVSSAYVITLGCILHDVKDDLKDVETQLGEAQSKIVNKEIEYNDLKKDFENEKESSKSLSKEKKKLQSNLKKAEDENKKLEVRLRRKLEQKKKEEAAKKSKKRQVSKASKSKTSSRSKGEASHQSNSYNGWEKMSVEATGYSLISDELGSDGDSLTATGTQARVGIIAVDPRVIPLGSTVYIPAMGREFTAEDTGGMIKGNKIDIYMAHGDQARQWGRRNIEIYIKP